MSKVNAFLCYGQCDPLLHESSPGQFILHKKSEGENAVGDWCINNMERSIRRGLCISKASFVIGRTP